MRKKIGTELGKKPRYLYQKCQDCTNDSYDVELANMLYFSVYNVVPARVTEINDQYARYRIGRKLLRTRKNFRYEKCNLDNYHLILERKRVAMLKETLGILQNVHGEEHNDEDVMKRLIRQRFAYFPYYVEKYIFSFLRGCEKCRTEKVLRIPVREGFNSNIFERIRMIEYNRLPMLPPHAQQETIDLVLDINKCFYDCTKDHYEAKYVDLLNLYHYDELPTTIRNKKQRTSFKAKKHKLYVMTCVDGTEHLYRAGKDLKEDNEEKFKRIPMVEEGLLLMKKLHGQEHRSVVRMLRMVRKTFYSYQETREFIEENAGEICEQCKKQLAKNPIVKFQTVQKRKNRVTSQKNKKAQYQEYSQESFSEFSDGNKSDISFHQENLLQLNEPQQDLTYIPDSIHELQKSDPKLHFFLHGLYGKGSTIDTHGDNSVIMIRTKEMKEKYDALGDAIELEQAMEKSGQAKWAIYLVTGLDISGQKIVLAICLLLEMNFPIMYNFLELTLSLYPNLPTSIYIPQNPTMIAAFNSLTYYTKNERLKVLKFVHHWPCMLQKFVSTLSMEKYKAQVVDILESAQKVALKAEFERKMKKVKGILVDTKPVAKLEEEAEHWAVCHRGKQFVGLGARDRVMAASYQAILENPENKANTPLIIQYIIKSSTIEATPMMEGLPKEQLFHLYQHLSKFIYNTLEQRLSKAQKLISREVKPGQERVIDDLIGYDIKYQVKDECWVCQCGSTEREGLPCLHLLTVLLKYRADLRYYVNNRWLI